MSTSDMRKGSTSVEVVGFELVPVHITTASSSEKVEVVCTTAQAGGDDDDVEEENQDRRLPPADKGLAAWRFLVGAFIIEALIWGFLLTFGLFQEYYSTHPPLSGNQSIPWIGVLGTGTLFLGSPFMTSITQRYAAWQKKFIWTGWMICIAALVSASFCTSLAGLAATQGFLYGFGFLVLYYPVLSMMDGWFILRRGFAYGLLFGASGVSGVVLPLLVAKLLERHGYQTTLRALAGGLFVHSGPAILMLRRRDPVILNTADNNPTSPSPRLRIPPYLHNPQFYLLTLSNLTQSLGLYIPLIYLPTHATDLGYSPTRGGATLLALANAAQVVGQVVFGHLSDKMDVQVLVVVSSGTAAVAVFVVWGLAKTLAPLMVFALIYGAFAGGFVVLWPRIGVLLGGGDSDGGDSDSGAVGRGGESTNNNDNNTTPRKIYSLLAFEKGIGNVISGPVSSALILHQQQQNQNQNPQQPQSATTTTINTSIEIDSYATGKYQGIVVFVGVCMALSAVLGGAARWVGRRKSRSRSRSTAIRRGGIGSGSGGKTHI